MNNQTKLFQYVIYWNPTKDQEKEGLKPKIIIEQKNVLVSDIQKVNIIAARDIPDEYLESLEQIVIAVRPF